MSKESHSTSRRVAFSQASPSSAPAWNMGFEATTPTGQPSMRPKPVGEVAADERSQLEEAVGVEEPAEQAPHVVAAGPLQRDQVGQAGVVVERAPGAALVRGRGAGVQALDGR